MSFLTDFADAIKGAAQATFGTIERAESSTAGQLLKGVVSPAAYASQQVLELARNKAGVFAQATAGTAPGPSAMSEDADLAARLTAVKRWKNILVSLDQNMAQRAGAANLTQAVQVWRDGLYANATAAIESALALNRTVTAKIAAGENPDHRLSDEYLRQRSAALDAATKAEGYAVRIQTAIEKAWADFSARGAPKLSDFALAPVTGAYDAASGAARTVSGVYDSAAQRVSDAGAALRNATVGAVGDTKDILKYAAIGIGALAVLYGLAMASPFVPRPVRNPPPRRRRRSR